jgi:serine protease
MRMQLIYKLLQYNEISDAPQEANKACDFDRAVRRIDCSLDNKPTSLDNAARCERADACPINTPAFFFKMGNSMRPLKLWGLFITFCWAIASLNCGGGGGGGGSSQAAATFTISGTIMAAAGNQVDSDVNDSYATTAVPNNDISSAQPISTPGVIGGYLNVARAGATGQSYANGDTSDFFQVTLDEAATIRLVLPDERTARVRFALYDQQKNEVATAADVTKYATLAAESAGLYYIEVRVLSGATSYHLMVGAVLDGIQSSALRPEAEFVPGEVLVQLKANPQLRKARSAARADFSQSTGLKTVRARADGWMHLRAEDRQTVFERLNIASTRATSRTLPQAEERRRAKQDTLRMVHALRARSDVAFAQPNYIRRPYYIPNDPLYPLQWHLGMIHLPAAWDISRGSADVIVAVIDTGVLLDHPDLAGKTVAGYDFISDAADARDGDGIDDNATDPGNSDSGESSFHGTHVAGTIAAAFNNGVGVAGVGGATRIMPVRVLGRDGGTDADIANAIRWAAGLDVTIGEITVLGANPRADIINMSFGGPGNSEVLAQAVADARGRGVILIAAAGNETSDIDNYPAALPEVVSVSAVDANAPTIDVAAPGGDINVDLQPDGYADGVLSTLGSDAGGAIAFRYSYYQGTSMAAAHMSGVAALMKAVRPGLTPAALDGYIAGGMITSDLGEVGRDNSYGYGLIDAYQAVTAAAELDPPTILSVAPATLRLDATTTTVQLFLRQEGNDSLSLDSTTVSYGDGADWLVIERTAGQSPGDFGQYTVTVNRTGLEGGTHTAAISFNSSANIVRVPVTIDVLPDIHASTGTQYVLLVNAATDTTVAQIIVQSVNGVYHYSFENVPSGFYYLQTSSDLNNDYRLMDQGEAVGVYSSIEDLASIHVNHDMPNLNFVTGFTQWPFFLPASTRRLP